MFEADRHFDSLTQALAFILGEYVLRDPEHDWTTLESGIVVPYEIPRYLFRGECGNFATTIASGHRLDTFSIDMDECQVPFPTAELLKITKALVWRFQEADYGLNVGEILGLFQHYRFPTTFLDFTKRADCASAFAATEVSPIARIAVIPWSPSSLVRFVDLADHPWAVRPRRQAAVGVNLSPGVTDLKSSEARSCLNVKWYEFPVLPSDKEFFTQTNRDLVTLSGDPSAGFLRFMISEYVEGRGKLSPALARWLAERVPMAPHCYLVRAFEEKEVVVNYQDKDALSSFDEEVERRCSERYWSSAYPESHSWDRMRGWRWPNVGQVVADPRTYHPQP